MGLFLCQLISPGLSVRPSFSQHDRAKGRSQSIGRHPNRAQLPGHSFHQPLHHPLRNPLQPSWIPSPVTRPFALLHPWIRHPPQPCGLAPLREPLLTRPLNRPLVHSQRLLNPLRAHLPHMRHSRRKQLQPPLLQHPANLPEPCCLRPFLP